MYGATLSGLLEILLLWSSLAIALVLSLITLIVAIDPAHKRAMKRLGIVCIFFSSASAFSLMLLVSSGVIPSDKVLSLLLWILAPVVIGGLVCYRASRVKIPEQPQNRNSKEEFRCLQCGVAIASSQQVCQNCGWTWK